MKTLASKLNKANPAYRVTFDTVTGCYVVTHRFGRPSQLWAGTLAEAFAIVCRGWAGQRVMLDSETAQRVRQGQEVVL